MFTSHLQELRRETSTLNLIVDANDGPIQGRKVAKFVKFVTVSLRSLLHVFFLLRDTTVLFKHWLGKDFPHLLPEKQ